MDKGGTVRVAEPLQGRLLFDGVTSSLRPVAFPTVYQRMDAEGAMLETVYLWPGDALPPYPASDTPLSSGPEGGSVKQPNLVGAVRAGPNKGLLAGAGVTVVASGALYGTAFLMHSRYYDLQTDVSRLDSLRRKNNSLVVASGAALAAAVGLGTSALLTGHF